MSDVPGKLTLDKDGRLQGNPQITYNKPWPLRFAKGGVTGAMKGVLLHTMVGSLESCIATFNSPNAAGSAHIGIGQDGRIHQFVPIGKGFETYHAFSANIDHYGIETEDMGNPHTPISDKALWAWAQCFEFLSDYAGFPCEVNDDCAGKGLAYHRMCKEWNQSAHSCPGASMTDMVRVNQRAEIVRRAKLIRAGQAPPPVTPPEVPVRYAAKGTGTLSGLAKLHGLHAEDILWQTCVHTSNGLGNLQTSYFRAGNWNAKMPSGMIVWLGKTGQHDVVTEKVTAPAPPPPQVDESIITTIEKGSPDPARQVSWMRKLLNRRYGGK